MTDWHTYERKRAAQERRWIPVIEKELNKQVKHYVDTYKAGRPDLTVFTSFELAKTLFSLYGDVGGYFARTTNRELRGGLRSGTKGMAQVLVGNRKGAGFKSAFRNEEGRQVLLLKRGSLGFSIDWANRVIEKLRLTALNIAAKISNYTRTLVLKILADAQEQNLSLDETVKLILEKTEIDSARRAETIARTEVGRAATEGKMEGAKALGVELEKVWLSARDNRTRHTREANHWVLNEQRRPMDEPFSDGINQLMQPGDKNAPAAETINCRCTVVFEVKKDINGRPVQREYITV